MADKIRARVERSKLTSREGIQITSMRARLQSSREVWSGSNGFYAPLAYAVHIYAMRYDFLRAEACASFSSNPLSTKGRYPV
jgi:hypothetical protein